MPAGLSRLDCRPLTAERWKDLERLFGPRGAYGGCWCMWWRTSRRGFERGQGAGNRRALRRRVDDGEIPGLLGYLDGEPVAWCSVAPREQYASLERSRVLRRLDDRPVWSVVCFFVAREQRGRGLGRAMLRAAVDHVRRRGGRLLEGYPTRPRAGRLPPVSSFMGLPAWFEELGFRECARPSPSKIVFRRTLRPAPARRRD